MEFGFLDHPNFQDKGYLMAIKDIIGPGIGFSPGSAGYIVTRGLSFGISVNNPPCPYLPRRIEEDVLLFNKVQEEQICPRRVDGEDSYFARPQECR